MRGGNASKAALLLSACAALASGCGGGSRQDAGEPDKTFTVATKASFPTEQSIVRPELMTVEVRNASAATMPNVAVTVDSFDYASSSSGLADNKRPVWVIEQGPGRVADPPPQSISISPPGGGQTAYVNTWALGPLAPGHARTFVWRVTPVKAGTYTVHYTVAAGLAGRSKARLADGSIPQGHFTVSIAPRPPAKHINPNTGRPAPGRYPPPPYPTPHP
ncbi:MAG TPA: hypothetical protein VMG80_07245 [Solirubrobacteraceae bacterium]|nr:hypothetical protein [Solirubrobacteraceae bacterium]